MGDYCKVDVIPRVIERCSTFMNEMVILKIKYERFDKW
jgi:hypothetical protein